MKKISTFTAIAAGLALILSANLAFAASTPVLGLSLNGSTVQISVTGADPYATVLFDYPNGSTDTSINLGQTDQNGSFTASVASNSYGLVAGSSVYVSVDGAASSNVSWPSNSSTQATSNLYLAQQSVTVEAGQSASVLAINVLGTLSIPGNTNPSAATASIQGSSIIVNALSAGATTMTVCATSGCSTLSVLVQSSNASGQTVSFSQTQSNINVGQSQTVTIYGPGTYYGLTNSNQNAVSAVVNGSNLVLNSIAPGQSIISLCATGWQCGTLTVNSLNAAAVVTSSVPTVTTSSSQSPQISSISISSTDINNSFFGAGSILNVTFSTNQPVINAQIRIASSQVSANGSGEGLYTASYTLNGNEGTPIPVIITFTSQSGISGSAYFWLGNNSVIPTMSADSETTVIPAVSASASNISSIANASAGYDFSQYLYNGSTGPQVTALQERLTTDGIYSGPITGTFGPLTKAAVKAYQAKHGLDQLGVVGPATRALLNQGI
jgi:hypothetical protein